MVSVMSDQAAFVSFLVSRSMLEASQYSQWIHGADLQENCPH